MKKSLFIAAMAVMVAAGIQAQNKVPAYRGLIERVQPNGDTLRTYLRGDEHMHWMMTEDGWQIIETGKGWLKYAKTTRKGQVKASCRKAHNVEDRKKCEIKWLDRHGIKKNL